MMVQLAEHGLIPIDLAKTLIDDAFKAAKDLRQRQEAQQFAEQEALENGLPPPALGYDGPSPPIPSSTSSSTTNIDSTTNRTASSITPVVSDPDAPSDIRYTVLSHLFILCIADGIYDARERVLLRTVAKYLSIPWTDVIQLEINIAEQLRVQDYLSNLRKDEFTVGKRNLKDSKGRWLFMGLATLGKYGKKGRQS